MCLMPNEMVSWHPIKKTRTTLLVTLGILVWSVAVCVVWWLALAYEYKEIPLLGSVRSYWPSDTSMQRDGQRPTIVFFLHPRCPCTRAALAELERLWVLRDERVPHRLPQLIVVVTVPAGASPEWTETTTVERAKKLSGATLVIDRGGHEARRFGATTSGTIMWFDASGRGLYVGGITASRGHEGDNAGRDSLAALLQSGIQPASGVPALGCRLCLPEDESPLGELAER